MISASLFNGEWDELALRLRTLDKLADRFVLVESNRTHQSQPKEYTFENPPDEFAPWLSRIRYIKVDDPCEPDERGLKNKSGWLAVVRQLDAVMLGLGDVDDDDVVMLSDVDEIPDPTRYGMVLDALEEHPFVSVSKMGMYMFWLNAYRGPWSASVSAKASTWRADERGMGRIFQDHKRGKGAHSVDAGGWHFSFMGPWERIEAKMGVMGEKKWSTPEFVEKMRGDYENDRYGFLGASPLTIQPIDHTFPLPLQECQARWAHIIKEPPPVVTPQSMVERVKASIAMAEVLDSKVDSGVLALPGFSSPKVRHLLNNLCNFAGCNYLEIGSWRGSTVISAAFRNHGQFAAIESFCRTWKAFDAVDSPRDGMLANKQRFQDTAQFTLHESDSWKFDISLLPPAVNVYFYDGDHTQEGTAKAFTHFDAALADTFILVMDDWNRGHIRGATIAAIASSYTVLYEQELFTPGRKHDTREHPDSWWNGVYVAVLRKGN